MSYRITNQMANFINYDMLNEQRLLACRPGSVNVTYIRNSQRNIENTVIHIINTLLASGSVSPSDIFILGASVKGPNSPIRKMENVLVQRGLPCFVPMLDTDNIDDKIIHKKIVFSTFHSVKGRQRKYVFVLGFDQGYMRFYCKNLPQDLCPSTLYVACTRATEGLYLLERNDFETDKPLDFLKMSQFELKKQSYVDFKGCPYFPLYDSPIDDIYSKDVHTHYVTPTDLIKFIPETVLETITPILENMFITIKRKGVELNIPTVIETSNGSFEDVSDLNGIAIPAMYYDYINSLWNPDTPNVLYETILIILDEFKDHEHAFLKHIASKLPSTFHTPSDYLFLANAYLAFQEKLYFKLKQINIHDYNWLNDSLFAQCKKRLDTIIGTECKTSQPLIEKTLIHQSQDLEHSAIDNYLSEYFDESIKFRFTARVDIITTKTIWELKCVREITMDHQLQVVIYAWLYNFTHPRNSDSTIHEFKLYNIRTGEIQKLHATQQHLDFIVISLLQGKYQEETKLSDSEFLNLCCKSFPSPTLTV